MEPIHPKFVHLPLALSVLLPLIGGLCTLAWWRGWFSRRIWIITALLHAVFALSAFAAMQTGEIDERVAQAVISDELIRDHESAAELFLWSTIGAFFLALIAAIAEEERVALRFAIGTVTLAVCSCYLAFDVGNQGGKLVYQYGAARAFIPTKYGGISPPPDGVVPPVEAPKE